MFCEDERDDLEDQYMIQEVIKIGEGSFGRVYKAIDLNDDSYCAVKVISKAVLKNAALEQSILQSLNHLHIIKFKRVCENKNNLYMVMELIEGGSLAQYVATRKQLPIQDDEASLIMSSILRAVEYIHGKQIIHRDLKPENILLSEQGDPNSIKIADFGLSFQFSQDGTFNHLLSQKCGTMLYMAPEQVGNQQYGKAVDMWSCGIIMYMLLSMGRHPLYVPQEDTKERLIEKIQNPVWEFPENFSPLAIDFFRKLTIRSQSERYKVGQALLHPWITRKFNDDIPMTFDQRRLLFDKEQKIIQLMKGMVALFYLHKKAHKIERTLWLYKQPNIVPESVPKPKRGSTNPIFPRKLVNKALAENEFSPSTKSNDSGHRDDQFTYEARTLTKIAKKSRFNDLQSLRRKTQLGSPTTKDLAVQVSRMNDNHSVKKDGGENHSSRGDIKTEISKSQSQKQFVRNSIDQMKFNSIRSTDTKSANDNTSCKLPPLSSQKTTSKRQPQKDNNEFNVFYA